MRVLTIALFVIAIGLAVSSVRDRWRQSRNGALRRHGFLGNRRSSVNIRFRFRYQGRRSRGHRSGEGGGCRRRNCRWCTWSDWSDCGAPCGGKGQQIRHRNKAQQSRCGGQACNGEREETRACTRQCGGSSERSNACSSECGISCSWGEWTSWTDCSEPCGGYGNRTRTRNSIISSESREDKEITDICSGTDTETDVCNQFCYNGGTYKDDFCLCEPDFSGICCEEDDFMTTDDDYVTMTSPSAEYENGIPVLAAGASYDNVDSNLPPLAAVDGGGQDRYWKLPHSDQTSSGTNPSPGPAASGSGKPASQTENSEHNGGADSELSENQEETKKLGHTLHISSTPTALYVIQIIGGFCGILALALVTICLVSKFCFGKTIICNNIVNVNNEPSSKGNSKLGKKYIM